MALALAMVFMFATTRILPIRGEDRALGCGRLPVRGDDTGRAFAMTALGTISLVATLFVSLYPRVMVSSTDFENSLTVDGAASSHYALQVMSVVALIFVPLVLLYQGWTYYVFRHRVGGEREARRCDAAAVRPRPAGDAAPGPDERARGAGGVGGGREAAGRRDRARRRRDAADPVDDAGEGEGPGVRRAR